jgi:ribose 5-phosphate isomerase B
VKRFEIITEVDARRLTRGETVVLARGGHVTPLARDTLRETGVTLVEEDHATAAELALAPVSPVRSLAVGSDHAGKALRLALVPWLRARGLAVTDLGTNGDDPVDYPDVAEAVALAVSRKEADAGLVVDGGGIGSAVAANKVPGVRAAMAATETIARYAREHVGANVLALGASLVTEAEARRIVEVWLGTPMREPRYIRRLAKIARIERGR